ncbi:hypothetical protein DGo_CA2530 [Deinococcus gobiensis I-0]|uniref:Uncharacterized protein n=1 Tax=Deinococcus gobiensis (strain DSM 21396 / JCM 16679 / CGMCC 1.7299 / I-0) TaxID=745776 RepID=H8GSJ6_DEIGI|nr:hypothetical protein DGo_CA2530 [Deinococcus gobiensis I-0]
MKFMRFARPARESSSGQMLQDLLHSLELIGEKLRPSRAKTPDFPSCSK